MTIQHIGKSIYNSAKLISQAAQETLNLFELIENRFNSEVFEIEHKNIPFKILEYWTYDEVYDPSGWILNGYAETLGITRRMNGVSSFLWIQLSLFGDENEFEEMDVKEPLLHICLMGHDLNYSDGEYININDINNHVYETNPKSYQGCFWYWANDKADPLKQEWYYSLKLTSLNSVEDVDQKIITPVKSLLSATSSTEKDSAIHNLSKIDGILRYTKVDDNYVAENG